MDFSIYYINQVCMTNCSLNLTVNEDCLVECLTYEG